MLTFPSKLSTLVGYQSMALILNIDTALQTGSVCLSENEKPISFLENTQQGQQANWVHNAIKQVISDADITFGSLNAVAVSNGPGSYTGLRIGLSTAKGICYALKIPLICINTLTIMASAVAGHATDLICPMIDARRMEVFAALYDRQLNIVDRPKALVLEKNTFSDILACHKVLFTGDGSKKFKELEPSNATFVDNNHNVLHQLFLSAKMYAQSEFADLAYSEPEYLKPVYTK